MKKNKAISLLLSMSLIASLAMPNTLALSTYAADTTENSGMVINKTAEKNAQGGYTISLEAYATGSKVITEVTKDIPTDIVLVLDQSGSMDDRMTNYDYRRYSNKSNGDYYKLRHNGAKNSNLYYKCTDGSYAPVSMNITQGEITYDYVQCSDRWHNYNYSEQSALYVKNGEEYQEVFLRVTGNNWLERVYTYTFPDGSTVTSNSDYGTPNFGGKGPLYYRTESREMVYVYTYTDQDGVTQTLTSAGQTTQPNFPLYERYQSSTTTRREALKTAVTGFANSVKTKAIGADGQFGTEDDINHRVAVVGFATGDYSEDWRYPLYENTEVFIGANEYNYNSNASAHYKDALQNMNTSAGYNNVIASKNALAARGATYPNYGLRMAKGILDANPVPEGEKRNQVVILFTDGTPGYNGYDSNVASDAVDEADNLKNSGVTVYTVGVFEGADATAAGIAQGANSRLANQFMQDVSSNKGTPRDPSYYLSASDANTLNNIFKQISDQIETGGSSTTLNGNTIIKDIIAPSFQLPEGVTADDIKLETYSYGGGKIWTNNNNSMGATAVVNGDKVDVTGFNFAANWCGTETSDGVTKYRGSKLVISFDVVPKPGFLGGNKVPTNTKAGVYEDGTSEDPVFTFPVPKVDVAIKDVAVTAPDKDVYLLQDVSANMLKSGTVTVGNVLLDLTQADNNYGLDEWQNKYVDIIVDVKDKDGNPVTDLNGLTDDSEYTISVTVKPKDITGTATAKSGSGKGKINVYKPQLTFEDGEAWYGGNVPSAEKLGQNLTGTKWLHGDTEADTSVMGDAPQLTLSYTPDASQIINEKINTKQDVPVAVGVKLGEVDVKQHTTIQHTDCGAGKTCTVPAGYEFLLHINTCQLTITKSGGAENEPYVFTVYRDGNKYSEVTIVGNQSATIYELPVGSYTITEDTNWSWRYTPSIGNGVSLTADSPEGSISCSNKKEKNYWLNGFSNVVTNILGEPHNK